MKVGSKSGKKLWNQLPGVCPFSAVLCCSCNQYCLNQRGAPFEGTAAIHILLQQFGTLQSLSQSYIHPIKTVSELQELSEQSRSYSWYSSIFNHYIMISRACQIICVHRNNSTCFSIFSSWKDDMLNLFLNCSPWFVFVHKFFDSLRLSVPLHAGPVGMAGSVPAAVCARLSGIPGLRRYGHHSVLIKPNVILTTGGFGEERGQHCRMRNFHVLSKRAGYWEAVSVTQNIPDKRWGEFSFRWQVWGGYLCAKTERKSSEEMMSWHSDAGCHRDLKVLVTKCCILPFGYHNPMLCPRLGAGWLESWKRTCRFVLTSVEHERRWTRRQMAPGWYQPSVATGPEQWLSLSAGHCSALKCHVQFWASKREMLKGWNHRIIDSVIEDS